MTSQVTEILVYRGQQFAMQATPLDPYLRSLRGGRRRKFAATSTAHWRGYLGTWEIIDGMLTLVALEGDLKFRRQKELHFEEADLATAFPWHHGPLQATWFTDTVTCPEGRLLDFVHAGFRSVYERTRSLRFEAGRLVEEFLCFNPPAPLIYRINPDGSRQCIEFYFGPQEIDDPFQPDEEPIAHLHWGRAPPPLDLDVDYPIAPFPHRGIAKTTD